MPAGMSSRAPWRPGRSARWWRTCSRAGLIPLRINLAEAATRWQEQAALRRGRIPSREVVNFTQELAALLKAGLPLDRSLQALEQVTSRSAMKAILAQVLRDLQEGKTLGDALSRARHLFPPLRQPGPGRGNRGLPGRGPGTPGGLFKDGERVSQLSPHRLDLPHDSGRSGQSVPDPHAPLCGAAL